MSNETRMLSALINPASIRVVVFVIVSTLAVMFDLSNFYHLALPLEVIQKPSVNIVWIFYLPTWILTNAAFGGIHGAPAWSFIPSLVIAVVVQNALLWLIAYKLINHFKKPSVTASGLKADGDLKNG